MALIAIAIAMAIMIAIPAGLNANQAAAVSARDNIQASITSMNNEIKNMSLVVEASYGAAGRTPGSYNFTRQDYSSYMASSTSTFSTTDVSNISSLEGVVGIVGYVQKTEGMPNMTSFQPGSFTRGSGGFTRNSVNFNSVYTVWGIPTNITIDGITPTIVSGRGLNLNETGSAVISQALATSWGIGVGGSKTIEGVTLTIVGIQLEYWLRDVQPNCLCGPGPGSADVLNGGQGHQSLCLHQQHVVCGQCVGGDGVDVPQRSDNHLSRTPL